MVGMVELGKEIQQLCIPAFEMIALRFPHYKAIYRIAEAQWKDEKYQQAINTLFEKLFLAGRRQRTSNFLEVCKITI